MTLYFLIIEVFIFQTYFRKWFFCCYYIAFVIAIAAVIYLTKWSRKRHDETGEVFPIISTSIAILILAPTLVFFLSGMPASLEIAALKGFNFKGGLTLIPELLALAFALSIYTATYIAEAVRAGIEAVPQGQKEAAHALGLKDSTILKKSCTSSSFKSNYTSCYKSIS